MANRREGLNALKKCLKKPYDSWTLQAFFGLYITEYEDRYKRKWQLSEEMGAEVARVLSLLIDREGMETAIALVKAVFKLSWVTAAQWRFLSNQDNIETYLIPEITKTKQPGEQAEWSGDREASGKTLSPNEFFYGAHG